MALPVVRTRDEAHLYLDLHPCDCGSVETDWESGVVAVDATLATAYSGTCSACGAEREFVFALPEREVPPEGFPTFGGPEPSQLLDAGEWLWVADLTAGNVPPDDPDAAHRALTIARAAVEEVLKFIPDDQDDLPDQAFWSERGTRVRAEEPGRFGRERLMIVRDTYRDLAAEYRPA
jgi:hypothetical protein